MIDRSEHDFFAVAIDFASSDGALPVFANLAIGALVGATRASIDCSHLYDDIAAIRLAHAVDALPSLANLAFGAATAARAAIGIISNLDDHAAAIRLAHAVDALSSLANLAFGATVIAFAAVVEIALRVSLDAPANYRSRVIDALAIRALLTVLAAIAALPAVIDIVACVCIPSAAAIRITRARFANPSPANLPHATFVAALPAIHRVSRCIHRFI